MASVVRKMLSSTDREARPMVRGLLVRLSDMTRCLLRIVLSALLIPALTGISTSCAPMGQAGSADSYATRAESHCDTAAAKDASGTTQKQQHSQQQHRNSTGTNCCPAIAGCAAVALPAIVISMQPATPSAPSVHLAYADLPIALAMAPEPPPPKA